MLGRNIAIGILIGGATSVAFGQNGTSSIISNFNGTSIAAGNTIWFNSVLKLSGSYSSPVTVYLRNASVSFGSTTVDIPDADITFLPTGTTGTISFGANKWTETVSNPLSGNKFLSGAGYVVPSGGISGGQNPVTWSAQFLLESDVDLQWQWAAAVYTSFSTDLGSLDVKPVDANSVTPWMNSDHAGTPESFKSSVIGGARGGGGSNFTGSYSGTASVHAGPVPEPLSFVALTLGIAPLVRRKRAKRNCC
ncbi:MAG: hypothetical protein JST51_13235 [Armatimonadetes bacterium]|nr:hypothetical protein [Armatimonadota bacterium]